MGGGDNEDHIWWVCGANEGKGDSSSFGGQSSELVTGRESSGSVVVLLSCGTRTNSKVVCDAGVNKHALRLTLSLSHTRVVLTLGAPERQK